ncbi:acyltransferase family protein [Brevundimonas goettingensis]|uniref:Acyltransferase family protein n=1 Tax=Brevundimonas goettingensis TaxID=2774190 RepID=A0A975GVG6_9CAUL|nr:acyltransferase family protein [Brevundimonas goettingensis]QTC91392.1 acyltransferase family protein [Brevundimonas goettingensis]
MSASEIERSERLHGLDALRGGTLLLGVVLHASMSFIPAPIWIVSDERQSVGAGVLFFAIHIFRMATFFLLAGLFAHMMLGRRGVGGFLKDRFIRIGGPLGVFWTPVMAAIIAVLIWSAARQAAGAPMGPPPHPPTYTLLTIPLTHLWFLWALMLFYVAVLILRAPFAMLDREGSWGRTVDRAIAALATPWGSGVLGAPLAAALWAEPNWAPFFGIPTPDHGLVPNLSACVGFGTVFVFGFLLDRRRDLLAKLEGWAPVNLILAVAAGTALLVLAGGPAPSIIPVTDPATKAMAAAALGVATFASAFAAVGLALKFFAGHSALRRYLADASYWIYIVHLPMVMAGQVLIQDWAMVWPVKLTVVVAGVLAVSLITYELLIRHSFMGRWLNGRRVPWRRKPDAELAPAE